MRCVVGQDTSLSQCLSAPRCINCHGNVTKSWCLPRLAYSPGEVALYSRKTHTQGPLIERYILKNECTLTVVCEDLEETGVVWLVILNVNLLKLFLMVSLS